jgi:hypothetical protein
MDTEDELIANYHNLKALLDEALLKAGKLENPYEAKATLIEVQQHFKGLKLNREEREELYNRLQGAFTEVNQKIDAEKLLFEAETEENFTRLSLHTAQVLDLFNQKTETREIWDKLIEIQTEIKNQKLKREDRLALLDKLQDGFALIKMERDEQQKKFQLESQVNYLRLKKMVDEGLKQAEESHEYKETREFLKKIQTEFKGLKMVHEQREELYSRLQTAFDILSRRLDDFFRNKKKNWETKMNFTLSRFDADNFELEQAVVREKQYLEELYDQLEILESAGKDASSQMAVRARIKSVSNSIELKTNQIIKNQAERDELKARLDQ